MYAMSRVQLVPPARVAGFSGQVPPKKGPLTETLLMVRATAWTLVSVSVREALRTPSAWFPNGRLLDESVTGTTPLPVIATDCELAPTRVTVQSGGLEGQSARRKLDSDTAALPRAERAWVERTISSPFKVGCADASDIDEADRDSGSLGILERDCFRRACFVDDLITERQCIRRQGGLSKCGQTIEKRQRKNSYLGLRRYYFFPPGRFIKTIWYY